MILRCASGACTDAGIGSTIDGSSENLNIFCWSILNIDYCNYVRVAGNGDRWKLPRRSERLLVDRGGIGFDQRLYLCTR